MSMNAKKIFLAVLFLVFGLSQNIQAQNDKAKNVTENKNYLYEFFSPEKSSVNLKNFSIDEAYKIRKNTFLSGYSLTDIGTTEVSIKDDDGLRLIVLDEKNKIQYKSRGQRDAMKYFLNFFENKNGKMLIICEIAFEYSAGLDIYLFENERITYLGNMDIAPEKEDTKIKDFVKISEKNNQIEFSFNGKKLLLNPGGEKEKFVENKGVKYVYKNGKLSFQQGNWSKK